MSNSKRKHNNNYNYSSPNYSVPPWRYQRRHSTYERCKPAQESNEEISKVEVKHTIQGSFTEFSNDLLSLLDDASTSDVSIKTSTYTLKAHKIILGARSPVFKAMFSNPMKETIESVVSIDDIDPESVRDLIHFIYSNEVQDVSVAKACDLLNAAEKYQMPSLKCKCVEYLTTNLGEDNAILILQEADLYDDTLKLEAIEFIAKNFCLLKKTEEWKNILSQNPTLAMEVLDEVVCNLTDDD